MMDNIQEKAKDAQLRDKEVCNSGQHSGEDKR